MTQELIDKLIAHYEWCIKEIEGMESPAEVYKFLRINRVGVGICSCAEDLFGIRLSKDRWVNSFDKELKYSDGSGFWFIPPYKVKHSKSEMLSALQFRIDRMKTFKP